MGGGEHGARADDDERALWETVLADPDDPAPRIGLALLWRRRGDPRAELVRIELALAAQDEATGQRDPVLMRRRRALLDRVGHRAAGPVVELVDGYDFHRGFVGEVRLPVDRFLEVADRLLRTAPVQHLDLTAPHTRLAELLRSPHVSRMVSLSLAGLGLDDEAAADLARAEQLRSLRWLSLAHNRIGRPGVDALAESPVLAGLSVLDLTGNPCDPVPRPSGRDLDGRISAVEHPTPWDGPVPAWLAHPAQPEQWPLGRDTYRRHAPAAGGPRSTITVAPPDATWRVQRCWASWTVASRPDPALSPQQALAIAATRMLTALTGFAVPAAFDCRGPGSGAEPDRLLHRHPRGTPIDERTVLALLRRCPRAAQLRLDLDVELESAGGAVDVLVDGAQVRVQYRDGAVGHRLDLHCDAHSWHTWDGRRHNTGPATLNAPRLASFLARLTIATGGTCTAKGPPGIVDENGVVPRGLLTGWVVRSRPRW